MRRLCEFAAKRGSLDLRFTPAPTAQQGIEGHAIVAARRGKGYQKEIRLSATWHELAVSGRADGFDETLDRLDEVKTHISDLKQQADNHRHLHWAQALIYGHMFCQQQQRGHLRLALIYLNTQTLKETVFEQTLTQQQMATHFSELCELYLCFARERHASRLQRDEQLLALAFPYDSYRKGQRELAQAVYKAHVKACTLLAQASTGLGKTLATCFASAKAMPSQGVDKLFYLTAKNSGKAPALHALAQLHDGGASRLQVLELTAKEKACEHPDKACHGESCPLAKGFYDRLASARGEALTLTMLDQPCIRTIALKHSICPYYLTQELVNWTDVAVADYNHFFDVSAQLHSMTVLEELKVGLLVDEGHNLVDRARMMYTAQLKKSSFCAKSSVLPKKLDKQRRAVLRQWTALERGIDQDGNLERVEHRNLRVIEQSPQKFLLALTALNSALAEYLTEELANRAHTDIASSEIQQIYFDFLAFQRLGELFDSHSMLDLNDSCLSLRNIVPAALIENRWLAAHSCVIFSATLSPSHYFVDMLGLPEQHLAIDFQTPFATEQLDVVVWPSISTRYHDRASSLSHLVKIITDQFEKTPGNYLAFFSSFDYMNQVADLLLYTAPQVPQRRQLRSMRDSDRSDFLAAFTEHSQCVGFAVLGGIFGEAIDLPGKRLIGAFIATLGMPQINPINQEYSRRIDHLLGHGGDYVYLIPGLQKVVQAAGRVIRSENDHGTIHLLDQRFTETRVRRLLPPWWQVRSSALGQA